MYCVREEHNSELVPRNFFMYVRILWEKNVVQHRPILPITSFHVDRVSLISAPPSE